MTILKKKKSGKIEIDLTGPKGNAYFILGTAENLAKQLSLDWAKIEAEMTSGEYENLIKVFDSYFGEYVNLYR